jgi:hypothetical protein
LTLTGYWEYILKLPYELESLLCVAFRLRRTGGSLKFYTSYIRITLRVYIGIKRRPSI